MKYLTQIITLILPFHHTYNTICNAWKINSIPKTTFRNNINRYTRNQRKSCILYSSKTSNKIKLSRPERKALERKQKEQSLTKRNIKKSNAILDVSLLTSSEDILQSIKKSQQYENVNDINTISSLILHNITSNECNGIVLSNNVLLSLEDMESILSRLIVATLCLSLNELCNEIVLKRKEYVDGNKNRIDRPREGASIIRSLLRNSSGTDDMSFDNAITILNNELSYNTTSLEVANKNYTIELLQHRTLALSSVLVKYLSNDPRKNEDNDDKIVSTCRDIVDLYKPLSNLLEDKEWKLFHKLMPYKRIIQTASSYEVQRRSISLNGDDDTTIQSNILYAILDIITTYIPTTTPTTILPNKDSQELYEMLNNALIRRTVFMLGVVNISQLPTPDRGEVVFIGRSNVGKSSLVNMITNRKSLAYTSKQPGKTQQFNYFAINDIPDLARSIRFGDEFPEQSKDRDSFYLVDVPGYGYAHGISKEQKEEWITLLTEYITVRHKTLKVIFHLIDSRIGITSDDDNSIMKLIHDTIQKSKSKIYYAIVLTKVDKNKKEMKKGIFLSKDVMENVNDGIARIWGRGNNVPIVLSSSESKLGRDFLWKYIRFAADCNG